MNFFLFSSCFQIPYHINTNFGGEDACFSNDRFSLIGVADGVGGWRNVPGADSSRYSHEFMDNLWDYKHLNNTFEILENAYNSMNKSIIGSTTVTIAKLLNTSLSIANIGDSGCGLFRRFRQIYHTNATVHKFNFPFQLGHKSKTKPSNATIDNLRVNYNDILVCASDGLWDNLFIFDIEDIIFKSFAQFQQSIEWSNDRSECHSFLDETARRLARKAFKRSYNTKYISPFAIEAKKNNINVKRGGKLDDITVVVGIVKESKIQCFSQNPADIGLC